MSSCTLVIDNSEPDENTMIDDFKPLNLSCFCQNDFFFPPKHELFLVPKKKYIGVVHPTTIPPNINEICSDMPDLCESISHFE
jgi:hypothetical protein